MPQRDIKELVKRLALSGVTIETGILTLNPDDRFIGIAVDITEHGSSAAHPFFRRIMCSVDGVAWQKIAGATRGTGLNDQDDWSFLIVELPPDLVGHFSFAKGEAGTEGGDLNTRLWIAASDAPLEVERRGG